MTDSICTCTGTFRPSGLSDTVLTSCKWICVGVDEAKVVSKGKLVCVVMDDENGDYYINNFKANA